jgi:Ca2+-binding EF-hand superfamily protein
MTKRALRNAIALTMLCCAVGAASADDKADYDKRAAARYTALFQSLDRNGDGVVSREEAQGDVNFLPRFDDMDINRDNVVSTDELRRFIESRFGVNVVAGQGQGGLK